MLAYLLEKQQHGQVLSESLMETAAHDSADLGNAHEMGEEIHATYHREMEATWGPDHITTVLEDYAQHIILGVHKSSFSLGHLSVLWPPFSYPSHVNFLLVGSSSPSTGNSVRVVSSGLKA